MQVTRRAQWALGIVRSEAVLSSLPLLSRPPGCALVLPYLECTDPSSVGPASPCWHLLIAHLPGQGALSWEIGHAWMKPVSLLLGTFYLGYLDSGQTFFQP